ncbi:MAG: DJ-1/PfpI family protein [Caulobacterales bacterium]
MNIGFVLFPNVTQLDFTGPLQVLHRMPGATTHILAKTLDPVPSDCGLSLVPTGTFAQAPPLDMICVPGGFGVSQAMADAETLTFVAATGGTATYVTSVCTGAFILGAAGLLRGKRATTHWAYHHLLSEVGALPTQSRVVFDGNTITGGGVTAGIDFALAVLAKVAGSRAAHAVQVALEYDPAPPSTFEQAGAEQGAGMTKFYASRVEEFAGELRAVLSSQAIAKHP